MRKGTITKAVELLGADFAEGFAALPAEATYAIFHNHLCIYIGETMNVPRRVWKHAAKRQSASLLKFQIHVSDNRHALEHHLIKSLQPTENKNGEWHHSTSKKPVITKTYSLTVRPKAFVRAVCEVDPRMRYQCAKWRVASKAYPEEV